MELSDAAFVAAVSGIRWSLLAENTKHFFYDMVPILKRYAALSGYRAAEKIIFEIARLLGHYFAAELKEKAWPHYEIPLEKQLPPLSLPIDAFVQKIDVVDWNNLVHHDEDFKQQLLPYMQRLRNSGLDCFLQTVKKIREAMTRWNPTKKDTCIQFCNDIVQKILAPSSKEKSSTCQLPDLHRSNDEDFARAMRDLNWKLIAETSDAFKQCIVPYLRRLESLNQEAFIDVVSTIGYAVDDEDFAMSLVGNGEEKDDAKQPAAGSNIDPCDHLRQPLQDVIWEQDRTIWDPSTSDAAVLEASGFRLSHMRLPPGRFSELDVMPKADDRSIEGKGHLTVPPDGKCILYGWMAARSPEWWRKVPRHPSGHIRDVAAERLIADEARKHLGFICSLARAAGDTNIAQSLESGNNPGDEEFKYYAEYFQCSFLILPMDQPRAVPWIYGKDPVGFAVEFFLSPEGNRTGHFELVHSWIAGAECFVQGLEDVLSQVLPQTLRPRQAYCFSFFILGHFKENSMKSCVYGGLSASQGHKILLRVALQMLTFSLNQAVKRRRKMKKWKKMQHRGSMAW